MGIQQTKPGAGEPSKGRIFDLKRYSIHDGPGIRTTVFFKGCPLHCLWCHNPEGIDGSPELMHWESRCTRCYACLAACPKGAISTTRSSRPTRPSRKAASGAVVIDRATCDLCGRCVDACLYEAMQLVGHSTTVAELVEEIEKDRVFFEQSGGGATFSGGEPLAQPEFLEELIDALRGRGIRTALDTTGLAPAELLSRIAAKTDLVLYDLKIMDEARHRELTGVSNRPILENLARLAASTTEAWVRIPLMAGVNDGEENIRASIAFLGTLRTIKTVGLLPYHAGGDGKARRLGKDACFRSFESPSDERYAAIEAAFRDAGFRVQKGG
jgi:pyruvate formate lyase activating enzyme